MARHNRDSKNISNTESNNGFIVKLTSNRKQYCKSFNFCDYGYSRSDTFAAASEYRDEIKAGGIVQQKKILKSHKWVNIRPTSNSLGYIVSLTVDNKRYYKTFTSLDHDNDMEKTFVEATLYRDNIKNSIKSNSSEN